MKNKFIFLLSIGLLLSNCQNAQMASPDTLQAEIEAPQTAPPPSPQTPDPVETDRKIIRTADYRYQVKNVEKSTEFIRNTTQTFGGFITQMNQSNDSYAIRNEFTIKVPADQFEAMLEALVQDAIFVNHKRISSEDVTSQFVDIEARLATKKAVRDRYIDILRNKTGEVKDVLEAEEKIRQIQEEIEAKEAQLRYLSAQVQYSTVELTIYQELEYRSEPKVYKESFWVKMSKSLGSGWQAFLSVLLFLIRLWPLLIVAGIAFWQRKRLFRRRT